MQWQQSRLDQFPLRSISMGRRSLYLYLTLVFISCIAVFRYLHPSEGPPRPPLQQDSLHKAWNFQLDAKQLLLDSDKCERVFPGLFDEVDRAVSDRKGKNILVEELDAVELRNGYIRAMLYDQELYVIATEGGIYSRGLAVLHAMHRAIVSSPDYLPNIEFVVSTDDKLPPLPIWSFARERNDHITWLMPDFGFWSWPETKVGSYGEVQRKAVAMEQTTDNPSGTAWTWPAKVDKLLWRGATMSLPLREKFLKVTKDKPWADVKAIEWHNAESMQSDLKTMDEHCQYKYLAHTEGNSYSGRLKYLQNCESVIVAHDMDWVQHYTPLMASSGPSQNYVKVRRDFRDLESTMLKLQNDDELAARIASNSVKAFRERYLTPAGDVCYWRHLIRRWADVSFEPTPWRIENGTNQKIWRGLPVESYLLERRLDWDPY